MGNGQDLSGYESELRRHHVRNVTLNLTAGIFAGLGFEGFGVFSSAPLFLSHITESKLVIALIIGVFAYAWRMPQVISCYVVARSERRVRLASIAGAGPRAGFILFGVAAALLPWIGKEWAFAIIGLASLLFLLTASLTSLAWQDATGRLMLPRRRGMVMGLRHTIFLIGAWVAKVLAARYLSLFGDEPAPQDFAGIFLAAGIIWIGNVILIAFMKEPYRPGLVPKRLGPREYAAKLAGIVRGNALFRRFLVVAGAASLANFFNLGFFCLYAQDVLGIPQPQILRLIPWTILGTMLVTWLWGLIGDRFGFLRVATASYLLRFLSFGSALALPLWGDQSLPGFMLVIVLLVIGMSADWLSYSNITYYFSSVEDRPFYISLAATATGACAFVSICLGGFALDLFGYTTSLVIASALALGATLATIFLMEEPREHFGTRHAI